MEPVGLGVKVQQPFETLGNVVNMANTVQQMQRGNLALQTEDMVLRERKGVEQFLANPGNFINSDGSIDPNKLQIGLMRIAPTTGHLYAQPTMEAHKVGTEAKKALNELSEQERGIAGKIANSAIGLSQDQARKVLGVHAEQNPRLAPIFKAWDYALGGGQKSRDAALMQIGRSVQPVSEQQKAIEGNYLQTGGKAVQTSPTAIAAGQAKESLPITLLPGQREEIVTDVNGNKFVKGMDENGAVLYTRPVPGFSGYQQQGGQTQAPRFSFPPGESSETAVQMRDMREAIEKQAATAPEQHFNNQEILRLAPEAFTGANHPLLEKFFGSYGMQWSNDKAANTAQMRHFAALQVQKSAAAAGANTDQSRGIASASVLPSDSPEKAIKELIKINDAYVTGSELMRDGARAALSNPNNQKDIFALRDFRTAWAQNFDPRMVLLEDAQKRGDAASIERIKKALGENGISELKEKIKNIQKLISTGAL